jgi:hypothetical protein
LAQIQQSAKLSWKTTACAYVRILSSDGEKTTQPCGGELLIKPKKLPCIN